MINIQSLKKFKNNNALISPDGKKYKYQVLIDYIELINQSLRPRSLVCLLADNSIGCLIGYISFLLNKVVPILIDSNLDQELLENLINEYEPEYIWMPSDSNFNAEKAELKLDLFGYRLYQLSYRKENSINDDLGLLLPTSGSTGSPKLVRLSYKNILSNAESIVDFLSIDEEERPIISLPMHYSFGLSIINSHLLVGATILLTNRSLMEKEFWSFMKDNKATSFSGVPYTFEMLKKLRFFRMELPYLKTITQAGGKLNDDLHMEFSKYCQDTGKRFFIMYGQTEATARMSYLPHEDSVEKIGSVGIPIPGGEFSLVDKRGKIIRGTNQIGELMYKGNNVSMGYAVNSTDLLEGDANKGILLTGDMAKRDMDGYYYIVGRKKRFIKLYGKRINIDEVEQIIKSVILDCACTGQDDKMTIHISDKTKLDEIKSFISNKMSIHPNAFEVKYIHNIPKTFSGKIKYSELE